MNICLIPLVLLLSLSACAQPAARPTDGPKSSDIKVGGRCEDCEAIYLSPVPFSRLNHIDTLPDFSENGPRMEISGTIYQPDGTTPAANVVMYFYHTNQEGIYPARAGETGALKKHGYLRGWIRTGTDGRYAIYTLRPASYPNSRNPAHIHATIKEDGKSEYWIDDFLFADDPFLDNYRNANPRGGAGVLTPTMKDGLLRAKRDIVLGKNVEGYPLR